MRPSVRRLKIPVLSFAMPLPGLLSQCKHHKTLYGTLTGRDNLLLMSMIEPLFSFLLSMVGSRRIFHKTFSVFSVHGQTGFVQISGMFLSLSSKTNARARQDLYNSKHNRFVHTCCYNQHKVKVPRRL